MSSHQRLIQALQNKELYEHSVAKFEVIETHISWILLTGLYAYKIKKPICFPFVDFSSLEKQKFYCEEELRLNKRLAQNLYLEVLTIYGDTEHPSFTPTSTPTSTPNSNKETKQNTVIGYALKMKQFDQAGLLPAFLQDQKRPQIQAQVHAQAQIQNQSLWDDIAVQLAKFHQSAAKCPLDLPYGSFSEIKKPMDDNFVTCFSLCTEEKQKKLLQRIQQWSTETAERLKPIFIKRKEHGFVRECHGDLHLNNMVNINSHVIIFDCIEFNPALRWIDTINDIAFLIMDLNLRQRFEQANYFLNRYLELTGDYEGLVLLKFYVIYRAMVRAKIALISPPDSKTDFSFQAYLDLCNDLIKPLKPRLIITYGVSGSGKTSFVQQLSPKLNAIHLHSDIERKRAFFRKYAGEKYTIKETKETESIKQTKAANRIKLKRYTQKNTESIYERLLSLVQPILQADMTIIVDATFIKQSRRALFLQFAREHNIPFFILEFETPLSLMKKRVENRFRLGLDASEADLKVLNLQLKTREPLTAEEKLQSLLINTAGVVDIEQIICQIKAPKMS